MPPLSFLKSKNDSLFIGAGNFLYKFDLQNNSIKRVQIDDEKLPELYPRNRKIATTKDDDQVDVDQLIVDDTAQVQILALCLCADENLLVACDSRKNVLLYETGELQLKKFYFLNKPATSVNFCSKNRSILVADRAGNVTRFDLDTDKSKSRGTMILGHVSVIFDLVLSQDEKFLATCDRDEKIRISRYPNSYNIESFCLGHKKFVYTLTWVNDHSLDFPEILASGSGDGFVVLWDYKIGKLLHKFNCNYYVADKDINLEIRKIRSIEHNSVQSLIILFHNSPFLLILNYCIICNDEKNMEISYMSHHLRKFDDFPIDMEIDD